MTDLTEKWKKGKLKEGAYYVRNEHDVIFTAENYINYDCFNDTKTCDFYNVETTIVEVLAPVPSYDEWHKACDWELYAYNEIKRLKHDVGNLGYKIKNQRHEINNRLKEIKQLKELLKECRDVAEFTKTIVNKHKWFDEVITKIDEVLKW